MMKQTTEFCCYLDGQPDHLTPEHLFASRWIEDMAGHPLFLNENCEFTKAGMLPHEFGNDVAFTDSFAAMENMAWVRNPMTKALQPFWLGTQGALSFGRHAQWEAGFVSS